MNLSPEKKIAGVLAPLFALRSDNDLGIGDVEALRQFVEWIAESGFKLVQLLPINEIGGDHSPYNAISAMAIEPTTLHLAPGTPAELSADDFAAVTADIDLTELRRGPVRYPQVKKLKRALLERAFERFNFPTAFEEFVNRESEWLDQYVFFRALMERNDESEAWDHWPEEHRSFHVAVRWRDSLNADDEQELARREQFFAYVQWIAHKQWRDVRQYANNRGVALMGDIPFGVSYYSADVWAKPNNFLFDWCGGAPPEPYFKDDKFTIKWGQNWGVPLYNWSSIRERDFAWWRERVRGVGKIFDVFRIDHVLGFYRIYAFPWRPTRNKEFLARSFEQMLEKTGGRAPHFSPRDDSTWQNCEANRREGEEYLHVVLDESRDTRVVGEDLGTVPDYVRPSLRSLGIAGFKIPQWEVHGGRVTPGSEYERLSVATYATHDHKPLRKLWEEVVERPTSTSEQAREALEKIAEFARFKPEHQPVGFEENFYPAAMEALFQSQSWIALVMITDLLALKYRFNTPGTAAATNWTRRMQRSIAQLRSSPKEQKRTQLIRQLLERSGRI